MPAWGTTIWLGQEDSRPALQARGREIVARRYIRQLAEQLAEQAGAGPEDIEAHAVAGALMATHRALVARIRRAAATGRSRAGLAQEAHAQVVRAFARLDSGLAGYGQRTG